MLHYKKPAALFVGGAALLSAVLSVAFLANPAKAKENENIFYGVVIQTGEAKNVQETIVRIPGYGDVVLPEAKDVSLYLERDAEQIILSGDLLRITFSTDQEVQLAATEQYGKTLYRFAAMPEEAAESIQVMGEGFSLERREGDRYLFAVPLGMADQAKAGDTLELFHDPNADSTEEIYLSAQEATPEQVLFAAVEVLSVDAEHYDIWVELGAEEAEIFLSEFGFGVTAKLIQIQSPAGTAAGADGTSPSASEQTSMQD